MHYKEARIKKNKRCEDRRKRRWKTVVEKPPLRVSQICAYARSIEARVSQICAYARSIEARVSQICAYARDRVKHAILQVSLLKLYITIINTCIYNSEIK